MTRREQILMAACFVLIALAVGAAPFILTPGDLEMLGCSLGPYHCIKVLR